MTVTPDMIFDLDDGDDRSLLLDANLYAGSGKSDMAFYVAVSSFTGRYAYFYTAFEDFDSGFEEWSYVVNDTPATPSIDVEKYVSVDGGLTWEDADIATGPLLLAEGESPMFKFVVQNTGNVGLFNITLSDSDFDLNGADPGTDILITGLTADDGAAGGDDEYVFYYTADWQSGQHTNTATVTTTYLGTVYTDSDDANYFGASPELSIEKLTNGGDGVIILAGEAVTWTYAVTNTGDVALTDINVADDQGVTPIYDSGDDGDGILQVGETWLYKATGTAVIGDYANVGTATGKYGDVEASDTDDSSYFGADPAIQIDKVTNGSDGPTILAGEAVTWTYTVTNVGNIALANVEVTDDQGVAVSYVEGDANDNDLLDLDETWIYEASGTAVSGSYANIGTATGEAVGTTVSDDDPSSYFGAAPSVTVDKQINGFDDCFDILVDTPITYTFVVTNTGNVALVDLVVTDNVLGALGTYSLDVGGSVEITVPGTAVAGEHENIVTVSGGYEDSVGNVAEVSASDDACYFGADPAIQIDKVTNGSDGPTILAGEAVTWTYAVTNVGNIALANVEVTDDQGVAVSYVGGDANGNDLLDLDETWIYEASGTAVSGSYANIGTATGEAVGTTVSDDDPSSYLGVTPAITVDKQINGFDDCFDILVNSPITYTFTVSNIGDVDLVDLVVTDNVLGSIGIVSLAAGESYTWELPGTAVAGEHENTVTVSGEYSDEVGNTVNLSASDDACYFGLDPKIQIDKVTNGADGVRLDPGEAITWTYTVTNIGNVDLTNVVVMDDNGTPDDTSDDWAPAYVSGDDGDGILQVNEVWTFEAFGTADYGDYENIGTVTADYEGTPVTDEDASNYIGSKCYEGLTPGFWKQAQNWAKAPLDWDLRCYLKQFADAGFDKKDGVSMTDIMNTVTFAEAFGVPDFYATRMLNGVEKPSVTVNSDISLLEALNLRGNEDSVQALYRHATASLLNSGVATHQGNDFDFLLSTEQVIDLVQDVFIDTAPLYRRQAALELKDDFAALNELGAEQEWGPDHECPTEWDLLAMFESNQYSDLLV